MQPKTLIKKIIPRSIISFFRKAIYPEKIYIIENNLDSLLKTYYQKIAAPDFNQKISFRNAEFKVYSKHGGDGLLLYIFSKIGCQNRTFVEMGVEDGRECNTANLSLNFGWKGIIIDANKEWMESAQIFYRDKLGRSSGNVKAVHSFVTAENINETISKNGISGEIDMLSIDIDSNDYWVWKAINAVNPRVVVMEYNSALGLKPITVKYNPNFHYQKAYKEHPLYFGASLAALAKLAKEKGYVLAGCDCHGHDAFFVRKDLAQGRFIELSPEEAFYPNPNAIQKIGSVEKQFEQIKHLEFDYV
ncbi:MAG: hypothetical protein HYW69_01195 [Candidatus Nealsonbacteria bacterium]|nr:hypothetical protein [Candidatus Nealsonbacteria bacterium]